MKNSMTAMAAALLCLTAAGCSDGAPPETAETASAGTLTGTWKADVGSAQFENDTTRINLANGQYSCESCIPPLTVTADGTWQTVDRPGYDGIMIEVVDDRTVKSASRLGDKDLGNTTRTVSEDGQTMTSEYTDLSGAEPVTGSTTYTRVAPAPEGSHAVSGGWDVANIGNMSDAGLIFSFTVDGDSYSSTGNGESFTATIGGEPVAIEGDDSGSMVAVTSTGPNAYRETYTRDGETTRTIDLTVDGDTLTAVSTDPRDNSTVRYTAARQ